MNLLNDSSAYQKKPINSRKSGYSAVLEKKLQRKKRRSSRFDLDDEESSSGEDGSIVLSENESERFSDRRGSTGRSRTISQLVKDVANKLTVFKGDNYSRWARECRRILCLTGVEMYIERDYSSSRLGGQVQEDKAVAAYLEAHLSEEIKNELTIKTGSAHDIWNAISSWYDDRDGADLDQTFTALRSLQLEGDNIVRYRETFVQILKVLSRFEVEMPNEFLVHSFLEGLGERGACYRREFRNKADLDPKKVCIYVARKFEKGRWRPSIDHVSRGSEKERERAAERSRQRESADRKSVV